MRRWAFVLGYTLFIYSILPFARVWQQYLRNVLGSQFRVYLNLFLIFAGLFPLVWLARKKSGLQLAAFIGLVLLAFVFAQQMALPEERIHLLQYAVLGTLCALAVSSKLKGIAAMLWVMGLGLLIGLGDELIQDILPSRVFDWWDVFYNSAGVFLGWLAFQIMKSRPV